VSGGWFDRALVPPARPGAWPGWARGRWEAFFFPTLAPVRLGALRVVFVALQMAFFMFPLSTHLALIEHNAGFHHPEPLMRGLAALVPPGVLRSEGFIAGLHYGSLGAGALALVGLFTRPALALFALMQMVLVLHVYSYGEKHHPEALYLLVLLMMSLGPCDRYLAVDAWRARRRGRDPLAATRDAVWPLRTGQVLLSTAYLMAGVCKIYMGGPGWLKGSTLQGYLLEDAVRWERPLGVWLARQPGLCTAGSIASVLFELAFPLVLVAPRLAPLLLVMGASFHLGVYAAQAAPFFQFIALYLMWAPLERWLPARGSAAEPGQG
jgi:uncharacterized membrane protein YphA (DoxX/SURF4 family)